MSDKDCINACEQVERSKLNRKILYYFAIFAISIKILRLLSNHRGIWIVTSEARNDTPGTAKNSCMSFLNKKIF